MKEMQIDIFGCEIPIDEVPQQKKPSGRRYKTMQEQFGEVKDKTCKTCKNCVGFRYKRTYYKCKLWIITGGEATDIRLKDTACGKYEAKE